MYTNSLCINCNKVVGYLPASQDMATFEQTEQGWLALDGSEKYYRPCANYQEYHVCNWMIDADDPAQFCSSCQLTSVIPNLHEEKNIEYWSKLEISKRRFLYITQRLDIFPRPKQSPDDALGLSFRFLVPTEDQPVMTGHANGVITLNAFEADHLYREQTRITMGENYRTLLGHFRHESGHYYFDVLIANTDWINEFRQIFGDERQDYGQALQHYYEHSAPKDWQDYFISTYASSHPWEDWAETWAHYLHMLSTLDTAYHIGMSVDKRHKNGPELRFTEAPTHAQDFELTLNNWFALSYGLNSLNQSMGLEDAYPFILSSTVLDKLRFIHKVLQHVSAHKREDKRFNQIQRC